MASRTKGRRASKQATPLNTVPQLDAPPAPRPEARPPVPKTITSTNNGTVKQGERKIMALTPDEIQALLGKTRQKGQYTEMLGQFLESGDGGVCANEQWVAIRDKKATTVKQGFVNAIEKAGAPAGAENVKVISNEDKVYLINLAAADVGTQEAA